MSGDKSGVTEFFSLRTRRGISPDVEADPEEEPSAADDGVSGRGLRLPSASSEPGEGPAEPPARPRPPAIQPYTGAPIADHERTTSWRAAAILGGFVATVVAAFGVALVAALAMLVYDRWGGAGTDGSITGAAQLDLDTGLVSKDVNLPEEPSYRGGGGGAVAAEDGPVYGPVVVTMQGNHPLSEIEILCTDGRRRRASLRRGNVASFPSVPVEGCELKFPGLTRQVQISGGDELICQATDLGIDCS